MKDRECALSKWKQSLNEQLYKIERVFLFM